MRHLKGPVRRPPSSRGAGPDEITYTPLRLRALLEAVLLAAATTWFFVELSSPAKAGRFLPEVANPYCDVRTYKLRGVAEQASSMTDRRGRPVIVVNAWTLRDKPNYSRFLLAHECCHHTLGHVTNAKKGMGHVGPQAFYYVAPELRRLELEADCCAVRLLRERREQAGIDAGAEAMSEFGDKPTGAYYPTGAERVENIRKCAAISP